MVKVNAEETLQPIHVSIAVEIDVSDYGEVVRENAGTVAGWFSRLGPVRGKVDDEIHQRTIDSLRAGLEKRLRPDVLKGIEDGVKETLATEIDQQLKDNDVRADLKVSVHAR